MLELEDSWTAIGCYLYQGTRITKDYSYLPYLWCAVKTIFSFVQKLNQKHKTPDEPYINSHKNHKKKDDSEPSWNAFQKIIPPVLVDPPVQFMKKNWLKKLLPQNGNFIQHFLTTENTLWPRKFCIQAKALSLPWGTQNKRMTMTSRVKELTQYVSQKNKNNARAKINTNNNNKNNAHRRATINTNNNNNKNNAHRRARINTNNNNNKNNAHRRATINTNNNNNNNNAGAPKINANNNNNNTNAGAPKINANNNNNSNNRKKKRTRKSSVKQEKDDRAYICQFCSYLTYGMNDFFMHIQNECGIKPKKRKLN